MVVPTATVWIGPGIHFSRHAVVLTVVVTAGGGAAFGGGLCGRTRAYRERLDTLMFPGAVHYGDVGRDSWSETVAGVDVCTLVKQIAEVLNITATNRVFRSGIHRKIPRTPLEAVSDGSYGAIEPLWHNRCDPSIRKHSDSCCSESRCSGGNQERDFLGRILRACDKPRFRSASKSVLGEAM